MVESPIIRMVDTELAIRRIQWFTIIWMAVEVAVDCGHIETRAQLRGNHTACCCGSSHALAWPAQATTRDSDEEFRIASGCRPEFPVRLFVLDRTRWTTPQCGGT